MWSGLLLALLVLGGDLRADTLPELHGENLAGETVRYPSDLEGRLHVMVVGMQRSHAGQMDDWLPVLRRLQAEGPAFEIHEVVLLGNLGRALRALITAAMKVEIRDDRRRARYTPVYQGEETLVARVPGVDPKHVLLLVVDGSGEVMGQVQGAHGTTTEADLRSLLRPR